MRKAPSVASSWLSWMSTLMTCTGWKVSCSRELRSERDEGLMCSSCRCVPQHQTCSSPSSTWSYTRSSQVITRSNWSLQLWKRSGRDLMRLLRSNMCKMPFCVYLRRISGQGRQNRDTKHSHVRLNCSQRVKTVETCSLAPSAGQPVEPLLCVSVQTHLHNRIHLIGEINNFIV